MAANVGQEEAEVGLWVRAVQSGGCQARIDCGLANCIWVSELGDVCAIWRLWYYRVK